jgi:hypothetical protein
MKHVASRAKHCVMPTFKNVSTNFTTKTWRDMLELLSAAISIRKVFQIFEIHFTLRDFIPRVAAVEFAHRRQL